VASFGSYIKGVYGMQRKRQHFLIKIGANEEVIEEAAS